MILNHIGRCSDVDARDLKLRSDKREYERETAYEVATYLCLTTFWTLVLCKSPPWVILTTRIIRLTAQGA